MSPSRARIGWGDIGREPFRVFFPAAVLAGLAGVSLWPLYFGHRVEFYPGVSHARIMAYGLFGGFILGFLGTAMPRMLSARPLRSWQVFALLAVYAGMVAAFMASRIRAGDILFLILLAGFALLLALRVGQRKDTPPPGFVLVGFAFGCVVAGSVLSLVGQYRDLEAFWTILQRLLCYQGFVLLPILGIGPFILPRFFGMPSPHDFPEMLMPPGAWFRKAARALLTGSLIIVSFVVEAKGWVRSAHVIRFVTTLTYLLLEMPFGSGPRGAQVMGAAIRVAFLGVLAGFLTVALWPGYRVALLHLTLVGGFALITFVVATRVVFGHSGQIDRLKGRNRWLLPPLGLMLFAMATRISGDFWPKIMPSHYTYGAILWIVGVLVWAAFVLPRVLITEEEQSTPGPPS